MLSLLALVYVTPAMETMRASFLPANSGELHNVFGLTLADRPAV